MATSERLKTIDSQINKLQSRKKKLEEKRKNQITTILNRVAQTRCQMKYWRVLFQKLSELLTKTTNEFQRGKPKVQRS